MLLTLRDIQANLYLTEALEHLRLAMAERAIAGEVADDAAWFAGECAAVAQMRQQFFVPARAAIYLSAEDFARYDAEQDFQQRSSRPADIATVASHRLIAATPVVGDPRYACPAPPGAAAACDEDAAA